MILYNGGIENHPDGSGDLNAIVNGNWTVLNNWFSPSLGLTASQSTTTVTASGSIFTSDDVGATIRFADGTTRTITVFTSGTQVTVGTSGTVGSQSFELYRTDQTGNDALMRGLTKRVRMLAGDDQYLFYWDQGTQRLVKANLQIGTGVVTLDDAVNLAIGSSTGTKIGTATSQKLGIWNAAPDVQPTNGITAAAFVANTSLIFDDSATFGGYTIGQVVAALKRIGLLA